MSQRLISWDRVIDTSISTVVHDPNTAADNMNHYLQLISLWVLKWSMTFNPDPTKQAVEVTFSRKIIPSNLFKSPNVLNKEVKYSEYSSLSLFNLISYQYTSVFVLFISFVHKFLYIYLYIISCVVSHLPVSKV